VLHSPGVEFAFVFFLTVNVYSPSMDCKLLLLEKPQRPLVPRETMRRPCGEGNIFRRCCVADQQLSGKREITLFSISDICDLTSIKNQEIKDQKFKDLTSAICHPP
jgi:hypothetical protein